MVVVEAVVVAIRMAVVVVVALVVAVVVHLPMLPMVEQVEALMHVSCVAADGALAFLFLLSFSPMSCYETGVRVLVQLVTAQCSTLHMLLTKLWASMLRASFSIAVVDELTPDTYQTACDLMLQHNPVCNLHFIEARSHRRGSRGFGLIQRQWTVV